MRRIWCTLAAATATAALLTGAASPRTGGPETPTGAGMGDVAIFYYPWYGTEARDGAWQHWQQHGNTPPSQLASGWFPARGPYSSSDPRVVRAQMREIASLGIRTVIVSWWGPGSVEDARLPAVMRAARGAGLRVALHVEPFAGRTPALLEPELRAFVSEGVTDFYIYDSTTTSDAEWLALNVDSDEARGSSPTRTCRVVQRPVGSPASTPMTSTIYDGTSFHRMCASARKHGLLCAPSVGPGYDAERATADTRIRDRADGATYDRMWQRAIRAAPDVITITSYNEWHEGTQIEPARAVGAPYASYDGAYGLSGRAAERAYLDRTAAWVRRYLASFGSLNRQ